MDLVFPAIGYQQYDPEFQIQQFSTFGYWRETLPEFDLDSLQL